MIIIDPLDQGPAVLHAERIGKPVVKQQVKIRTGFRIAVFFLHGFGILQKIAGAGGCPVNADSVTVCFMIGAPEVVFVSGRIRTVMVMRSDHPANSERSSIFFVDTAAGKENIGERPGILRRK